MRKDKNESVRLILTEDLQLQVYKFSSSAEDIVAETA